MVIGLRKEAEFILTDTTAISSIILYLGQIEE